MDQYHSRWKAFKYPLLDRRITREEFEEAVEAAKTCGLSRLHQEHPRMAIAWMAAYENGSWIIPPTRGAQEKPQGVRERTKKHWRRIIIRQSSAKCSTIPLRGWYGMSTITHRAELLTRTEQ